MNAIKGKIKIAPKGTKLGLFRKAGKIKLKITINDKVTAIPHRTVLNCFFSSPLALVVFLINSPIPLMLSPITIKAKVMIPGPLATVCICPVDEIEETARKTKGVSVSKDIRLVMGSKNLL